MDHHSRLARCHCRGECIIKYKFRNSNMTYPCQVYTFDFDLHLIIYHNDNDLNIRTELMLMDCLFIFFFCDSH